MIHTEPRSAFLSLACGSIPASVDVSRFVGESGASEYHMVLQPQEYGDFEEQLRWLHEAYQDALAQLGLRPATSVFRRFFCSDIANQADTLSSWPLSDKRPTDDPCAVSWVGQAPAPPAKVALWAYHIDDPRSELDKRMEGDCLCLRRGDLAHLWATGITAAEERGSYRQTEQILTQFESFLHQRGLSLRDNVLRTWFYVRDVDTNYQGLVDARREVFAARGLTADTHYIASTGIEGHSADPASTVTMDAYAISGISKHQIEFLSAPEHLSPTSIYGVTFERGVAVGYRDRKHALISGTASIDHAGNIVHPGNVLQQLERTLENIEALLTKASITLGDGRAFIVYVRDAADINALDHILRERLAGSPYLIVTAPVCRPGWLVEIECIAITPACDPTLPSF